MAGWGVLIKANKPRTNGEYLHSHHIVTCYYLISDNSWGTRERTVRVYITQIRLPLFLRFCLFVYALEKRHRTLYCVSSSYPFPHRNAASVSRNYVLSL